MTKLYREYWKLRGLGYTQFNIQRDKCQNMATLENIPTTSKEKRYEYSASSQCCRDCYQ